jgi:hypothetical protein
MMYWVRTSPLAPSEKEGAIAALPSATFTTEAERLEVMQRFDE